MMGDQLTVSEGLQTFLLLIVALTLPAMLEANVQYTKMALAAFGRIWPHLSAFVLVCPRLAAFGLALWCAVYNKSDYKVRR